MRSKIGIISLYYKNRNYGGLLQAYALQKFLQLKGYDCEQICYSSSINENVVRLDRIKFQRGIARIKSILGYGKYKLKLYINTLLGISIRSQIRTRISAFEEFQNEISHSRCVYSGKNIEDAGRLYDAFICGSDVIWNAGISAYVSCLGFVPDAKIKIAYAPSLGGNTLPMGWLEEYGDYLKRLNAISVRENSIKEQLAKKIPDLDIETMSDPTFLLTREQWEQELPDSCVEERYVFCYILGSNKTQRKMIKKWSQSNRLKIVFFPHIEENIFRLCDRNFGDRECYDISPLKYVQLIKGAEMVITDSFHAVAFSLLFNVNFRAINRMKGNRDSGMSGRIKNLLIEVGMENFFVQDLFIEKISLEIKPYFEISNQIIDRKRKLAERFLCSNLIFYTADRQNLQ